MKRFLLLFVAVCASFYVMSEDSEEVDAVESYSGSCGDNVTYEFNPDAGTLTISGSGEMTDYSSHAPWHSYHDSVRFVSIPDSVTSIGSSAFSGCTSLTSVTIPDSVTSIGQYAFSDCTSLTTVTIPDSVTSIGEFAFYNCTSLTTVTIPDSVTSIGSDAFFLCPLTSIDVDANNTVYCSDGGVLFDKDKTTLIQYPAGKTDRQYTIPGSVKFIGTYAFCDCTSLTTVTIPDSVTSIGGFAFDRCTSLTTVTIPDSVTSIGQYAFSDCTSLTTVTIPDSVTSIGQYAFSHCTSLTTVTIPDSVISIGEFAFFYCTSLTTVTIPDSVTSIGQYAFSHCTSLTTVTIPDSVTSISNNAFPSTTFYDIGGTTVLAQNAENLKGSLFRGTLDKMVKQETFKVTFVFADGSKTVRLCAKGDTSVEEPANSEISGYTNYWPAYTLNNVDLTVEEVKILKCDENITSSFDITTGTLTISGTGKMTDYVDGNDAPPWYDYRENIKKVVFEGSITHIGNWAFSYCSGLESITIPDSIITLGESAFIGCTALTSVNLGSVEEIGDNAFKDCYGVKNVDLSEIRTLGGYAFYRTDTSNPIDHLLIGDNVESIDKDAFNSVRELVIPIDVDASPLAEHITNLEKVTFTPGNTGEGFNYDYNNGDLRNPWYKTVKSVVLSEGIKSIGENGVYNCVGITELNLPASLERISNLWNMNLQTITVAEGNTSFKVMDDGILYSYDGKTLYHAPPAGVSGDIIIPDGVETIGVDSFSYATAVNSVTVADSVEKIGNYAFHMCTGLRFVYGNAAISFIGKCAFKDCSDLAVFECSIFGTVSDKAFYNCATLQNIALGDSSASVSIDSIGEYAFANTALITVNISDIQNLGKGAFSNCVALEEISVDGENESYCSVDGVLFSKDMTKLIAYPAGKVDDSYEIPKTVTTIEDYAFSKCTSLKSVDLSFATSIKFIGSNTFCGCDRLQSVNLGSVETIGDHAFSGCSALASVDLTNVTSVGNHAFKDCTSLSIADLGSMNAIGDHAFSGCSALASVDLTNVTSVGNHAFEDCTALSSADLGSMNTIGDYAFYNCCNLSSVDLTSVQDLGSYAFYGCTGLKELTIPISFNAVGSNQEPIFKDCTNIVKVIFTAGTNAGYSYGSDDSQSGTDYYQYTPWYLSRTALKDVVLSENITSVGSYAFCGCDRLQSVNLGSVETIGDHAFSGCSALASVDLTKVKYVGKGAFYECKSLGMVDLSNSGILIGEYAFKETKVSILIIGDNDYINYFDISNLECLIAPDCASISDSNPNCNVFSSSDKWGFCDDEGKYTVFAVKDHALHIYSVDSGIDIPYTEWKVTTYNTLIYEIIIHSGVTSICKNAFTYFTDDETSDEKRIFNFSALYWITVGEDVEYISEDAFNKLPNLGTIYLLCKHTPQLDVAFVSASGTAKLNSYDCKDADDNEFTVYCSSLNIIYEDDSWDEIEWYCVDGSFNNVWLKTIVFDKDQPIQTGYYKVSSCTSVRDIDNITDTMIYRDLQGLLYKATSTSYAVSGFENGVSQEIVIPECVVYPTARIGSESISISGQSYEVLKKYSITTIADKAFCNSDSKFTSIVIPGSITYIGANAFKDCTNLAEVIFEERTESLTICAGAFAGCTNLKKIILPKGVSLGTGVFEGCTSLTDVSFHDDIVSVPDNTFAGCTKLDMVRILSSDSGEKSITFGTDSFDTSSNLTFLLYNNVGITSGAVDGTYICLGNSTVSDISSDKIIKPAEYDTDSGKYYTEQKNDDETYRTSLYYHFDDETLTAIVGNLSSTADETAGLTNTSGCTDKTVVIPDYVFKDEKLYRVVGFDRFAFYKNDTVETIKFNRYIGTGEDPDTPAVWDCTFREISKLEEFSVPNNTVCKLYFTDSYGALYSKEFEFTVSVDDLKPETHKGVRLIRVPTLYSGDFTVWDNGSVTTTIIERYALAGCYNITSVDLKNVNYIGSHAFYNCTSLATVTGNGDKVTGQNLKGVTAIESSAFENCYALNSIEFENVKRIGSNAFYGTGLGSVSLPFSDLEYFGSEVFSHCLSLASFEDVKDGKGAVGTYVVYEISSVYFLLKKNDKNNGYTILQCPSAAGNSSSFKINLGDWSGKTITVIAPYAFYGVKNLTEFTMSDDVVVVGREAFAECSGLRIMHIGKAYYGSTTVPESGNLDTQGMYTYNMFGNDRALTSIIVDSENPYFCNDSNGILFSKDLSTLYCYPAGIQRVAYSTPIDTVKIYDYAFSNNTNIKRVIVTATDIAYIGSSAFANCSQLKEVFFRAQALPATGEKIFDSAGGNEGGELKVYFPLGSEAVRALNGSTWHTVTVEAYSSIKELENDSVDASSYLFLVRDTSGNPLSGAKVYFYVPTVKTPISATTDSNGKVALVMYSGEGVDADLPADAYRVYVTIEKTDYFTYKQYVYLDSEVPVSYITMAMNPTVVGETCNYESLSECVQINKSDYVGDNEVTLTNTDGSTTVSVKIDDYLYFTFAGYYDDTAFDPVGVVLVQNGKDDKNVFWASGGVKDYLNGSIALLDESSSVYGTKKKCITYTFAIDPSQLLTDTGMTVYFFTKYDNNNDITVTDPGWDGLKAAFTNSNGEPLYCWEAVNIDVIDYTFSESDIDFDAEDVNVGLQGNSSFVNSLMSSMGTMNFNVGDNISYKITLDGTTVDIDITGKYDWSKTKTSETAGTTKTTGYWNYQRAMEAFDGSLSAPPQHHLGTRWITYDKGDIDDWCIDGDGQNEHIRYVMRASPMITDSGISYRIIRCNVYENGDLEHPWHVGYAVFYTEQSSRASVLPYMYDFYTVCRDYVTKNIYCSDVEKGKADGAFNFTAGDTGSVGGICKVYGKDPTKTVTKPGTKTTQKFSVGLEFGGGISLEFYNNSLHMTEAYVYGQVTFKYELEHQFVIVVVPVVLQVEIEISGKISCTMLVDDERGLYVNTLQLEASLNVDVDLGVGCTVLSAGVTGGIGFTIIVDFIPSASVKELKLDYSVGLYAKVLWFKYTLKYSGTEYIIGDGKSSAGWSQDLNGTDIPMARTFLTSNYVYMDDGSVTYPRLIADGDNLYRICSVNDKVCVSAWDADKKCWSENKPLDSNEDNLDCGYWLFDNDGKLSIVLQQIPSEDSYLKGAEDKTKMLKKVTTVLIDVSDLSKFTTASTGDSTGTVTLAHTVTDSDPAGYTYLFDVDNAGKIVVWAENADFNMFGVSPYNNIESTGTEGDATYSSTVFPTDQNSIWLWENGSAVKVAGGLATITAISYLNGDIYYILDGDCNLNTTDDRKLFRLTPTDGSWTKSELLSGVKDGVGTVPLSFVKECVEADGKYTDSLYCYSLTSTADASTERFIDVSTLNDSTSDSKADDTVDSGSGLASGYKAVYDSDGDLVAALFTRSEKVTVKDGSEKDGSALYAVFRLGDSWGSPVKIEEPHAYGDHALSISDYDAVLINSDKALRYTIVYQFADLKETEMYEGEVIYMFYDDENGDYVEDIVLEEDARKNLLEMDSEYELNLNVSLSCLDIDYRNRIVTVAVTNNGAYDFNGGISIRYNGGEVSKIDSFKVLSGATSTFTVPFSEKSLSEGNVYELVLKTADDTIVGNSVDVNLEYSDFSVKTKQVISGGIDYMLISITNNGNVAGKGLLRFTAGNTVNADDFRYSLFYPESGLTLEPGMTMYYELDVAMSVIPLSEGMVSVYFETEDGPESLSDNTALREDNFSVLTFNGKYENVSANSSSAIGVIHDPYLVTDSGKYEGGNDIEFEFNLNNSENNSDFQNVFGYIECQGNELKRGTDYLLIGSKIILKDSWLSTLTKDTEMSVHFSCGYKQKTDVALTFTVDVDRKVDVQLMILKDNVAELDDLEKYTHTKLTGSDGYYIGSDRTTLGKYDSFSLIDSGDRYYLLTVIEESSGKNTSKLYLKIDSEGELSDEDIKSVGYRAIDDTYLCFRYSESGMNYLGIGTSRYLMESVSGEDAKGDYVLTEFNDKRILITESDGYYLLAGTDAGSGSETDYLVVASDGYYLNSGSDYHIISKPAYRLTGESGEWAISGETGRCYLLPGTLSSVPDDACIVTETVEYYLITCKCSVGEIPVIDQPAGKSCTEYEYVFRGWSTTKDSTDTASLKRIAADDFGKTRTYYAVFEKEYHTFDVTWIVGGSEYVQTLTYEESTDDEGNTVYGAYVNSENILNNVDSKITGWTCDSVFSESIEDLFVTGPVTITASICAHAEADLGESTVTVEPTCYSNGESERTCGKCGAVVKTVLDRIGHDYKLISEKPSTCVEDGMKEHYECTMCNRLFVKDGEKYTETTADALKIVTSGHKVVVDPAVSPTCTEDGKTAGVHCSVCNEVLLAQDTVDKLGHDLVAHEAKAATCTEVGWGVYETCSRCDHTTYKEISALGHDLVNHEAKSVSCTECGYDAYDTCSRCDYSTYKEIAAKGHTQSAAVRENEINATCTSTGSYDNVVRCSDCNAILSSERVVIPAKEHTSVTDAAVAATCTSTGLTEGSHCSVCGTTIVGQTVTEKIGHTPVTDLSVDPTCTTTGLTEGSHCSVCGMTLAAQEILAKVPSAEVGKDGKTYYATVSDAVAYLSSVDIKELSEKAKADPEVTLTVTTASGTFNLDNKALSNLKSSDSKVNIVRVDSEPYKDIVDTSYIYEITFGDNYDNFDGGSITVTVPYTGSLDNLKICYIADGEVCETLNCTYEDGYVTFTVTHLSTYAVVSEKSDDGGSKSGICSMTIVAFLLMTLSVAAIPVIRYVRL